MITNRTQNRPFSESNRKRKPQANPMDISARIMLAGIAVATIAAAIAAGLMQ